ncbi:helix-turn-helix transcriptional regulator [Streptomyces sp. NBC_00247]|uniref:helix-turn-helix domain-containing protein n=1 Tax=Streptomyces sp. NBC_00247 TaxID=2975689 RepID=UPI002E2E5145|nr:helix-turn-helix transcriptional regulator [Streptomyces sp. NBC_00247]
MSDRQRTPPPTVRLRRLAALLRRLRAEAELTREQVAVRTGVNVVTLYRIEKARARPQQRTLTALMEVYGAGEAQRADLMAAQRLADDRSRLRPYGAEPSGAARAGGATGFAGFSEGYLAYLGFEAEARTVRAYESMCVPELLQTERYARAVIRGMLPDAGRAEVDERVRVRMERRSLLTRANGPRIRAVLDEAAVRRAVGGPEVMREQAEHLVRIGREPGVGVRVIPFGAGAHAGMAGSFVHLDFPDARDAELVWADTPAGDVFLDSEEETLRYRSLFERLRAVALDRDDSAALLESACRSLRSADSVH